MFPVRLSSRPLRGATVALVATALAALGLAGGWLAHRHLEEGGAVLHGHLHLGDHHHHGEEHADGEGHSGHPGPERARWDDEGEHDSPTPPAGPDGQRPAEDADVYVAGGNAWLASGDGLAAVAPSALPRGRVPAPDGTPRPRDAHLPARPRGPPA